MSKELDLVIADCEKRMEMLNEQSDIKGVSMGLNCVAWQEAYDRYCAALAAKRQQRKMHWTTSGDFSHLQSTGAVSFR